MQAFVAVTDSKWYQFLSARPALDEINFWRPTAASQFQALAPGEPLLMKLHRPQAAIAGVAFFEGYCRLPLVSAWDTFREGNGAASLQDLVTALARYRKGPAREMEDVGCVILRDPTYFPRDDWIEEPADWSGNIVQGKGYDAGLGIGAELWAQVEDRLQRSHLWEEVPAMGPMVQFRDDLTRRRLGQGGFRALVTSAYGRRCAVTGERVLPVLEACHIQPATRQGPHDIRNGLLLRSDLHRLFDDGYLGLDPTTLRLEVSHKLRDDFANGREYYALAGRELRLPERRAERPDLQFLTWHRDILYRG